MGTDVLGYIEINTVQESGEDNWFKVVDIDVIAERNYEIFAELFGVRASARINPLAKSRGIPDSSPNKQMLVGSESVVYQSWIKWSETSEYLSSNNINLTEYFGWQFIFLSMENLAKERLIKFKNNCI